MFYSNHQVTVLWAYECGSCVGSINMHPDVVTVANWPDLVQSVEATGVGGSESGDDIEWNQTSGDVFLDGSLEDVTA